MVKKYFVTFFLILCIGLISAGCLRKTVVRTEPSVRKAEEAAAEREEAARLEAERKEREAQEREAARIKEEEARIKEEEAKMPQAPKEFEKSLVTQKTPGIEGEVFESQLLKDIHFDFDEYDIRPGDVEILKENAAVLNKFSRVKIQIEGHCDERGTNEYNLALGERRANSVKKYLISLGIAKNRISTISYGEEKPLGLGHDEEAWVKNRRAHFIILSR
jgi:peptidoglycan-associated lipoprotein